MKNIVILGGGISGIVTANKLRRKLSTDWKIILIERNPVHSFAPSFLWVMTGNREESRIRTDLKNLLVSGIELIIAEVKAINVSLKHIEINNKKIYYDYLIIALGSELAPEVIPGVDSYASTFYTLEGVVKLREKLKSFQEGNVAIVVCSLPYKCPGAPHEGALLISHYFEKKNMQDRVSINLYTPETQPMPVAGPELGKAIENRINSKGINFHPLYKLISVDSEKKQLKFENQETISYDLLIVIPPHRSPSVVRESGLTDESGWIPADMHTLETKHKNVFAIGDVTSIILPGSWNPNKPINLPKAGVFAHAQAITVSEIITSRILGRESKESFCANGFCMIEAGEDLAGFAYGNFYATPHPNLKMKHLGKLWHYGKILFEKWWLLPNSPTHFFYSTILQLGMKLLRIQIKL